MDEKMLESIQGSEFVEIEGSRESSLCCSGGGRFWTETSSDERFSNLRMEEAVGTSANVLATGCPFCILNFEDGGKTVGKEVELIVTDVVEFLVRTFKWSN
ncbi:MAG: (Fe-S)-binding protein [Thermoplasmata archaeon]|nr:(Fe-S)-binding protein [Thermoplasmata archaeon]